jgi:hypothetical protein
MKLGNQPYAPKWEREEKNNYFRHNNGTVTKAIIAEKSDICNNVGNKN